MLRLPIMGGDFVKDLFTTKQQTTSQVSPAQEAFTAAVNPILIGLTQQLGQQFPGVGRRFAETQRLSPAELNLSNIVGQAGGNVAQTLRAGIPDLTGPIDTAAFTDPLFRRFEEETLPAIRSKAIQFGAPGGSREGEVTGRALTRFGTGVGEALSRAELGRRAVGTQAFRSLLPQLFEAETAGGRQAAETGGVARALAGSRELAPLDLLIRAISGTPRPPFAPPTVTQRDRGRPIDDIFDIGQVLAQAFAAGGA